MTDTYKDLFVRNVLGDTNKLPKPVSTGCPDLYPNQQEPLADPQTTLTSSYTTAPSSEIIANAANYLYVRAKNYADAHATGTAHLYYTKSNLILLPSLWEKNQVPSSRPNAYGQPVYGIPIGADPQGIAVTQDPFLWLNPPDPGAGLHYCMILRVATAAHPNNIPDSGVYNTQSALLQWIAEGGGLGWHNVRYVTAGAPEVSMSTNYDQGGEGGAVQFGIKCVGIPKGATVSLSSAAQLPVDPVTGKRPRVFLEQTLTTDATIDNPVILSTSAINVPKDWRSTFVWSYKSNGKAPLPGWDLTLQALMPNTHPNFVHVMAQSYEELGYSEAIHFDSMTGERKEFREMLASGFGPTHAAVVGEDIARPK